jgi:hypothetical protein
MPRWTAWRKIAKGEHWYELSVTGGPYRRRIIKYVGETINEKQRIIQYAACRSHIEHHIKDAIEAGATLWYRGHKKATKAEAIKLQNKLLAMYKYDWNTQGQR